MESDLIKMSTGMAKIFRRVFGQLEPLLLSQRVRNDLKQKFEAQVVNFDSADFAPDLVIRNNKSALVIEIKTGDSSQPLPASANAQMLTLQAKAKDEIANADIVAVLVTNYQVDDIDRAELQKAGITIIGINGSTYDPKQFSSQIEKLAGQNLAVA